MFKHITALKITLLTFCVVCLMGASIAEAKVFWGFGTGLTRMNSEGDIGFNQQTLGPIIAEVDLAPDDFDDLTESAIGGGGYVTDGTWMMTFKLGQLKLGDDISRDIPNGDPLTAEFSFDITVGELTVGYTAYRSDNQKFSVVPFAGFRYMKHKIELDLAVGGGTSIDVLRGFENEWTDFLIGTSANYAFSPKWSWASRVDAGFGGSNGTFNFQTNLAWKFWKHMSAGPTFAYMAIEYENGEETDSDWYLYDANEFGVGFSFLFHF